MRLALSIVSDHSLFYFLVVVVMCALFILSLFAVVESPWQQRHNIIWWRQMIYKKKYLCLLLHSLLWHIHALSYVNVASLFVCLWVFVYRCKKGLECILAKGKPNDWRWCSFTYEKLKFIARKRTAKYVPATSKFNWIVYGYTRHDIWKTYCGYWILVTSEYILRPASQPANQPAHTFILYIQYARINCD